MRKTGDGIDLIKKIHATLLQEGDRYVSNGRIKEGLV